MAIKRKEKSFQGIDLSEANVEAIFKKCLSIDKNKENKPIILFSKSMRF